MLESRSDVDHITVEVADILVSDAEVRKVLRNYEHQLNHPWVTTILPFMWGLDLDLKVVTDEEVIPVSCGLRGVIGVLSSNEVDGVFNVRSSGLRRLAPDFWAQSDTVRVTCIIKHQDDGTINPYTRLMIANGPTSVLTAAGAITC